MSASEASVASLETRQKNDTQSNTSANSDETESQASVVTKPSAPLSSEESSGHPEDVGTLSSDSSSSGQEPDNLLIPTHACNKKFFEIVGENIDKDVKPRDMQVDYSTHSLHYFHAYAVHNCLHLTGYSAEPQHLDTSSIQLESVLLSLTDERNLCEATFLSSLPMS